MTKGGDELRGGEARLTGGNGRINVNTISGFAVTETQREEHGRAGSADV